MDDLYIYNSDVEINKLKKELMTSASSNYRSIIGYKSTKHYIYDCTKQIMNEQKGRELEENIRQLFEQELGLTESNIPRLLLYREIIFDESLELIIIDNTKTIIQYKGKELTFIMKDCWIKIIYYNSKGEQKEKNALDEDSSIFLENTSLKINKSLKKEVDGIFNLSNFDLKKFDPKETCIIFNNCSKFDDFELLVLEAKLSFTKGSEMVEQIKKDNYILSYSSNKKVLFLGIIYENSNNDIIENLSVNFPCIILLVKHGKFFGKDISKFYDWQLIKRVNKIEYDLSEFKNEFQKGTNELKDEISVIKTDISRMKAQLIGINTELIGIRTELSDLKNQMIKIFLKKPYRKRLVKFTKKKKERDNKSNDNHPPSSLGES